MDGLLKKRYNGQMATKQIFKMSFYLFLTSLGIVVIAAYFLLGDFRFLWETTDVVRAFASEPKALIQEPHEINLSKLTIQKENDGKGSYFITGEPLKVICGGKFEFEEGRSFEAVIKTSVEIFGKKTVEGKNGDFLVEGSFTPKEPGLIPIACRAEKERLLKFIFVSPEENSSVQ